MRFLQEVVHIERMSTYRTPSQILNYLLNFQALRGDSSGHILLESGVGLELMVQEGHPSQELIATGDRRRFRARMQFRKNRGKPVRLLNALFHLAQSSQELLQRPKMVEVRWFVQALERSSPGRTELV